MFGNCCYHVTTDNTFVWTLISSPNCVYLQSQNTKWLIVSTNRPFPHILKSILSPTITVINNVLVNSKPFTVPLQLIHVPPTDTTPVNSIDVCGNHPLLVITRLNVTHSLVTFFALFQVSSNSTTSSERTKQMLRARMKPNIWLEQDMGPLNTVTTTTIPPLPYLHQQPVGSEDDGECTDNRHAHCTIETCPQKRFLHELLIHLNRLNLGADRYAWTNRSNIFFSFGPDSNS